MQPVRILHVVTFMGRGGLETMLMNYYRRIDRQKVQFDFLVHRDFKADYDDEIISLGGKIHRIQPLNPFSPSYRKALDSFFSEHREYRVVHVHQDCMSAIALKAAKKHGAYTIAHSHNSNQDKNLKLILKLFYKRFIPKYADELYACGNSAGEWMFSGAPFTVIRNAIDSSRYIYVNNKAKSARDALGIAGDELVVGHIGRFSPQKNHEFVIDVFSELTKIKKARLLLIGDGELRGKIEEKVKSLSLTDKVIFTGIRSDVPELLQAMDVFLFPSCYEGLPVTLVEAQASALPCFISDVIPKDCDITPLINRLSLSDSPVKWADAIASNKNKRADTSKLIIDSGFDIEQNAEALESHYLSLYREAE